MLNKQNKIYMWYKVKELSEKGLNKSQISRQTGLDRATVRKYLIMNESEFHIWLSNTNNLPLKLTQYMPFVKSELQNFPDLSAAQIEDRLKEHFSDLPDFHSRTVFNFVQTVRDKYNIPKPKKKDSRVFEKLLETPYAEQSQVDFGETWMQKTAGKRQKIYFFAMVLSRSRFKFIYLDNKPFTASSSVHAHKLAFEYFQGVTKEILYDQDSVFMHDENLGDYLLTRDFQAFCKTQNFKTIFCRKADPQSKGKVENVVKYVKQNFLRGRKYIDIKTLNKSAIAWLERTGNAKIHSSTQKIPKEEWIKEKKYLLPVKSKTKKPAAVFKQYKVRKDNTIVYKSNFYSLPLGTYKNNETSVLLEVKGINLNLYSTDKELITTHTISINKGETLRNTDHAREKSKTIQAIENKVYDILERNEISELFLKLLKKHKSRYYRDNLQFIITGIKKYSSEIIRESLLFCIENKQLNSSVLLDVMKNKNADIIEISRAEKVVTQITKQSNVSENKADMHINKSNINDYEKIFGSCRN